MLISIHKSRQSELDSETESLWESDDSEDEDYLTVRENVCNVDPLTNRQFTSPPQELKELTQKVNDFGINSLVISPFISPPRRGSVRKPFDADSVLADTSYRDIDDRISSVMRQVKAAEDIYSEKKRAKEEAERKAEEARQEAARREKELKEQQAMEEKKLLEEKEKQAKEERDKKLLAEKKEKEEAEARRLAALKEQKEAEDKKHAEEIAAKEAATKAANDAKAKESTFVDWSEVSRDYDRYMEKIAYLKTVVSRVNENKEFKRACWTAGKVIRSKIGQLNDSGSHVAMSRDAIEAEFRSAKAHNDLAFEWVQNAFAKQIVKQAQEEGARTGTAQAVLIIELVVKFPSLLPFVIARFVKKCPWIIGYSIPVNTVDARKRMGWRRNLDGDESTSAGWEDQSQYDIRMVGMVTVWSLFTQTVLPANTSKHPYPISNAWIFAARMLDKPIKQLTNTHYEVFGAFWEAAGSRFLLAYGRQAQKVLTLAWKIWTEASNKSFPAAVRLRLLGEEYEKTGEIRPKKGLS